MMMHNSSTDSLNFPPHPAKHQAHLPPSQRSCPHPPSFLSAATKAEQYGRLRRFDLCTLRRPKAHCRNALRTTETVTAAQRRIKMGCPTSKVDTPETGERQSAVERVSVCSEVLQDLVGASGIFSPLLQRIKDAYDQRLQLVLSRASTSDLKRTGDTRPGVERPRSRDEVYQLRKRLHALEVQCRVKLQQNERLRKELSIETEVHRRALEQLQTPPGGLGTKPSTPPDFSSRVDDLQRQMGELRDAILREASRRTGCVPITVCHQVEQCLRETELKWQKLQKRNHSLKQKLQGVETGLVKQLETLNTTSDVASKMWKGLREGVV